MAHILSIILHTIYKLYQSELINQFIDNQLIILNNFQTKPPKP